MQTVQDTIITAGIDVQAGGLSVRISFSYQHPEFSTLLVDYQTSDAERLAEPGHGDALVAQLAAASGPALLEVFERSQLVVLQSLALHKQKQIDALQSAHATGAAAMTPTSNDAAVDLAAFSSSCTAMPLPNPQPTPDRRQQATGD